MICEDDYVPELKKRKKETKATVQNIEKFAFSRLTDDLKLNVVKKFYFSTRRLFEVSSLEDFQICRAIPITPAIIGKAMPMNHIFKKYYQVKRTKVVGNEHILFVVMGLDVRMALTVELVKRVRAEIPRMVAKHVSFGKHSVVCSDAELVELLKAVEVESLSFDNTRFDAIIDHSSELGNLKSLSLRDCCITDTQLLQLHLPRIRIKGTSISASTINQYLREWYDGFRNVVCFEVSFASPLENVDPILKDLPANIVWSADTHHLSIISDISLENVRSRKKRDWSMLFPFNRLTDLLKLQVVNKYFFATWTRFKLTSQAANRICDDVQERLPICFSTITVYATTIRIYRRIGGNTELPVALLHEHGIRVIADTLYVQTSLTSQTVNSILKNIPETTVTNVNFMQSIVCNASELVALLEALEMSTITFSAPFDPFLSYISVFKKLKSLRLGDCGYTDEQVLDLHLPEIQLRGTNVSPAAINQYLKQWYNGSRNVECFEVSFISPLQSPDPILEGLPASIVWSAGNHCHSIVSDMSIEYIQMARNVPWYTCYFIWRPSSINDIFTLEIMANAVYFKMGSIAQGMLFNSSSWIL